MTKYKIYQIISPNGEWFYCKEKFGPFWVTPSDWTLRWPYDYSGGGENAKCKRFKSKEDLIKSIQKVREQESLSLKYEQDQLKTKHIPLEEV